MSTNKDWLWLLLINLKTNGFHRSKLGPFKNKIKELRQGKKGKKDSGESGKELDAIVVQRLSTEVSGKAQKYSRSRSMPVHVFRRLRLTLHQKHQESVHEALRNVGNDVMRCTRRGAGTLLFLSKINSRAISTTLPLNLSVSGGRERSTTFPVRMPSMARLLLLWLVSYLSERDWKQH